MLQPVVALRLVKTVHTVVWAIFAGAIIAIPILSWAGFWSSAAVLTALVLVECLVLAFNRMRCPLTDVAARYTDDRRDNFDIYLPLWLAKYNQRLFGSLFAAGLLFSIALFWLRI